MTHHNKLCNFYIGYIVNYINNDFLIIKRMMIRLLRIMMLNSYTHGYITSANLSLLKSNTHRYMSTKQTSITSEQIEVIYESYSLMLTLMISTTWFRIRHCISCCCSDTWCRITRVLCTTITITIFFIFDYSSRRCWLFILCRIASTTSSSLYRQNRLQQIEIIILSSL